MFKRFLLFSFALLCVFSASAEEKPVPPMNVLFVGNSYTHMHRMPVLFDKIAKSKGVKLNVEMSAASGHSFRMHCERPELFEAINSKKWDYVILQGFSRELSEAPSYIDTASVPFIGTILDSIYNNNSCTNVLLYMTWGYKGGYEERPEVSTNKSMSDSIRVGYEYVSSLFNLPMVPVGPVWSDFRASNHNIELYSDDDAHPSFHGSYLIACSFYTAIFKTMPKSTYRGRIKKRDAKRLQAAAYNYVINNLDTFKLKQNTLSVEGERTHKGEYLAHCSSNYPNAKSINWEFGDGTSSSDANIVHEYEESGEYWITLTINDFCGVRKIKRKVKFKKPKRPSKKRKSKAKVVLDTSKKV